MGFNVDHSKLIRLSFCHVLSWFANITNSKPNTFEKRKKEKRLSWAKKVAAQGGGSKILLQLNKEIIAISTRALWARVLYVVPDSIKLGYHFVLAP